MRLWWCHQHVCTYHFLRSAVQAGASGETNVENWVNSNQQMATSFVETLHFVVYVCVDGRLTLLDGVFCVHVFSLLVGTRLMPYGQEYRISRWTWVPFCFYPGLTVSVLTPVHRCGCQRRVCEGTTFALRRFLVKVNRTCRRQLLMPVDSLRG